MVKFDFITGEDFRLSLESDYAELTASMQSKSWKAVHVLAGSIIEAILIDYLVATKKNFSTDPLKMDLSQAITECRKEDVLSIKTEQLSHVIRSYRNLIHPGRLNRLGETVNENGAKIAHTLVEIIVEEVASRKRANYGYTAEQIVSKIESDATAIAIIDHLLKETNYHETERLLLKIIPNRYFGLSNIATSDDNILAALITCYRTALDKSSPIVKEKVAKDFVKIIKEEISNVEWRYIFFRAKDLKFYSEDDKDLVKGHFISLLKAPIKSRILISIDGIGSFLLEKEIRTFILACLNSLVDDFYSDEVNRNRLLKVFRQEYKRMNISNSSFTLECLRTLYEHNRNSEIAASVIKSLFSEVAPFGDIESDYDLSSLDDHPF